MNDEERGNDESRDDENGVGPETWETLEAQIAFAFEERDCDPGDYVLSVDRDTGEVVLRTGEDVPGSRLAFTLEDRDFKRRTMPRLARDLVTAALGPEE